METPMIGTFADRDIIFFVVVAMISLFASGPSAAESTCFRIVNPVCPRADGHCPQLKGDSPRLLTAGNFHSHMVGGLHQGVLDLAYVSTEPNAGQQNLHILLASGDGLFDEPQSSPLTLGSSPVAVASGQFRNPRPEGLSDGDNDKIDLAVVDDNENAVRVFFGNGDGSFIIGQIFPVSLTPLALAIGSFRGLGMPRYIAVAGTVIGAPDKGAIATFLGNGQGGFTTGSFSTFDLPMEGVQPAPRSASLVTREIDGGRLALFVQFEGRPSALFLMPEGTGFSRFDELRGGTSGQLISISSSLPHGTLLASFDPSPTDRQAASADVATRIHTFLPSDVSSYKAPSTVVWPNADKVRWNKAIVVTTPFFSIDERGDGKPSLATFPTTLDPSAPTDRVLLTLFTFPQSHNPDAQDQPGAFCTSFDNTTGGCRATQTSFPFKLTNEQMPNSSTRTHTLRFLPDNQRKEQHMLIATGVQTTSGQFFSNAQGGGKPDIAYLWTLTVYDLTLNPSDCGIQPAQPAIGQASFKRDEVCGGGPVNLAPFSRARADPPMCGGLHPRCVCLPPPSCDVECPNPPPDPPPPPNVCETIVQYSFVSLLQNMTKNNTCSINP
jgi:hypothetical protein